MSLESILRRLDLVENQLRDFETQNVSSWPNSQQLKYFKNKLEALQGLNTFAINNKPAPAPEPEPRPTPSQNLPASGSRGVSSNDGASGAAQMRMIMNQVYKNVRKELDNGGSQDGAVIRNAIKAQIIDVTRNQTLPDSIAGDVKKLLNSIFSQVKKSFQPSNSYPIKAILDTIKEIIISTTKNSESGTSAAPTSSPRQQTEQSRPVKAESPRRSNQNHTRNNNTTQRSTPSRSEEPVRKEYSNRELSSGMEAQRVSAIDRIKPNPTGRTCDLTEPTILENYLRVRDDEIDQSYVIYGYDKNNKNKLVVVAAGAGGFNEIYDSIPEQPVYVYYKYTFGDTNRAKFVFLTYVPDFLGGMAKSRVLGHRTDVENFLKYFTITWHIHDLDDFDEQTLIDKLLSAGGANYSVQAENKGDFSSYKTKTKNFYSETEQRGNLKNIKFSEGPLSTTPCDISGRPSVANASQFINNTSSDFKRGKK
eukprot:TRINITY_DN1802_c0_g1_i1.p1 TRINITY_DN1802_c0_g1~~TRINITY_DN1802_c0_g1_i1.p1  ORF type:complete len:478 (+),score=97.33 TRINITY_DN1802_c0_g1_i1:57-1490(+)